MAYHDFDWGDGSELLANSTYVNLGRLDTAKRSTINGLLLAAVITARGLEVSSSLIFEDAVKDHKKRPITNRQIDEATARAWMQISRQANNTLDVLDGTLELMMQKRNEKNGSFPEEFVLQLDIAYESVVNLWTIVTDFMCGFRSFLTKLFKYEAIAVPIYLHRGMSRSQLKAKWHKEEEN